MAPAKKGGSGNPAFIGRFSNKLSDQERRDAGKKGFWTGGIQEMRDTGKEGYRKGGILDWRDSGLEG